MSGIFEQQQGSHCDWSGLSGGREVRYEPDWPQGITWVQRTSRTGQPHRSDGQGLKKASYPQGQGGAGKSGEGAGSGQRCVLPPVGT